MSRYPTDEELEKLIDELEQQKLYAPRHLKDEILLKVKEDASAKTGSNHQVSFLVYTFKMVAGMAAALFLIFAIPARDGSDLSYAAFLENESSIRHEISIDEKGKQTEESINKQLKAGRDKVTAVTDGISKVMDVIFQRNGLGGYDNEN